MGKETKSKEKAATIVAAVTCSRIDLSQDCRLYLQENVHEPPGNHTSSMAAVGAAYFASGKADNKVTLSFWNQNSSYSATSDLCRVHL